MIRAAPHPEDPAVVVLIGPSREAFVEFGLVARRDRFVWRAAVCRETLAESLRLGLRVEWPARKREPFGRFQRTRSRLGRLL